MYLMKILVDINLPLFELTCHGGAITNHNENFGFGYRQKLRWATQPRERLRDLRRCNHIHIFQGHVAGVGDVVPRCGRDINEHGRLECAPWLPLEQGFAPPAQHH
jgi:hypothetical protein